MMSSDPPRQLTPREICEQFAPEARDLEPIRHAQNRWRAESPVEAKAFFEDLLGTDPENPRYLYLAARVAPDPCESIRLNRLALAADPDLVQALRLLLYSYSWGLFRRGARPDQRIKLDGALQEDAHQFERAYGEIPFGGALLGLVLEYDIYRGDHDRARKTLKQAKKLGQDWAVDPRAPMVLRAARGEDDTVRKYVEKVVRKKAGKKLIAEEDIDAEIAGELLRFYKKALRFDKARELSEEWVKVAPQRWRPESFVHLARTRALLDDEAGALEALDLAVETGWDDPATLAGYIEFLRLHGRSGWQRLMARAEANQEATRQRHRREALERKVDQVPDPFVLRGPGGRKLTSREFLGKITILDFWATSCRPCRRLMPALDRFARTLDNERVQVYAVNCRDSNRAQAMRFLDLLGISLEPLFGDLMVERNLGITGVPALLVFDARGHIRFRERGQHGGMADRLGWWIEDLIAEHADGVPIQ